ncbi:50S ribosomal protein L3 [Candidatus Woesearchaeota archaeon]|nr:50S ribosomal protein L3 [Candidatus Woesearchaeota archaeon]
MPRIRFPRRGSLQVWPRVRAKRAYPRIRKFKLSKDTKLNGFIGYKVGMTHIVINDPFQNSPTKGTEITWPITVIECPPLKAISLRFYKNFKHGSNLVGEIFANKINNEAKRNYNLPKQIKNKETNDFDLVKLLIYTQPKLGGIGKKTPEILEIPISGDKNSALEYGKKILNSEIKITDVFKENQLVDLHGVTKGKGVQGPVKRFGVAILSHKANKTKRGVAGLGPWTPSKVSYRRPVAGKMGYHSRTEYNKHLIKIGNKPTEIIPKGDFLQYGKVKSDYILIKGSVIGARKRAIILTNPRREKKELVPAQIQISYISKSSKQG